MMMTNSYESEYINKNELLDVIFNMKVSYHSNITVLLTLDSVLDKVMKMDTVKLNSEEG